MFHLLNQAFMTYFQYQQFFGVYMLPMTIVSAATFDSPDVPHLNDVKMHWPIPKRLVYLHRDGLGKKIARYILIVYSKIKLWSTFYR